MSKVVGLGYVIDTEPGSYSNGSFINSEGVATIYVNSSASKVYIHNDDVVTRRLRLVVMI